MFWFIEGWLYSLCRSGKVKQEGSSWEGGQEGAPGGRGWQGGLGGRKEDRTVEPPGTSQLNQGQN